MILPAAQPKDFSSGPLPPQPNTRLGIERGHRGQTAPLTNCPVWEFAGDRNADTGRSASSAYATNL
jgi:hypothetical protein